MNLTYLPPTFDDPLGINRCHIELTDLDRIRRDADPDLEFWKEMDRAAELLGFAPFCPCGKRPHFCGLSSPDRAKGFVREIRRSYTHKTCGTDTTMGLAKAETMARDPHFYSDMFCVHCLSYFPLEEFVWAQTNERVGT
jgi:hypothetical protein